MSYVLSYIYPPVNGAAFGQATVSEPLIGEQHAADLAGDMLIEAGVRTMEARSFAITLAHELPGTQRTHTGTGLTFRIDPADQAPHPCPCDGCGRLVLPGDHAQAAEDDAFCLGCFTWTRNDIQCNPHKSAHANPWKISPAGARWYLEVTFKDGTGETSSDGRYCAEEDEPDDKDDAARVAWPALRPDQLIAVTLTVIGED